MAATVDNRVVSMEFDNAQFEKNVSTSIETLKKLDESLNFKNAENSFNDLEKAANNVKLSSISDALDKLNSHFTVWGIASRKIIEDITGMAEQAAAKIYNATIGQVMQGGWTRAANIEQAKFQLQGLGIAWDQVSDSISYAVDGTAYGLDSAAKAASQLAASGVELGQDMSDALRGISGVAAMTNSSYDDIARIFTTVAGNGRLMTMQLNQIGMRGINAAAELAKAMNITEGELRDMVTKGKIDFNTFAKAMDDAFGEHAKDANKTFTGVMSNIRAALSRIGAEFATPIMTDMVGPLNQLKDMIVNVKSAMQPAFDIWKTFINASGNFLEVIGEGINKGNILKNIVETVMNVFAAFINVLAPIGEGLANAFPEFTLKNIEAFTEKVKTFAEGLVLSEQNETNLSKTSEGLFSILNLVGTVIGDIIYVLSPLAKLIEPIITAVLSVTGAIGEWISKAVEFVKNSEVFNAAIEAAHNAVDYFATHLPQVIENLSSYIGPVIERIIGFFTNLASKIGISISDINLEGGKLDLANIIDVVFQKAKDVILGFISFLGINTEGIKAFFDGFHFPSFEEAVNVIKDVFTNLKTHIQEFVTGLSGMEINIGDIFNKIGEYVLKARDFVVEFVSGIVGAIDPKQAAEVGVIVLLGLLGASFINAVNNIGKASTNLINTISNMFKGVGDIFTNFNDTMKAFQNELNSEALKNIAEAIAILALSMTAMIVALTRVPQEELATALAASVIIVTELVVLIGMVALLFAAINKINGGSGSQSILMLAASLGIVAAAIKLIGEMEPEKLAQGVKGLAIAMAEMIVGLVALTVISEMLGQAKVGALVVMALALDALIPLLNTLGNFTDQGFNQALKGTAALIAELIAFIGAFDLLDLQLTNRQIASLMAVVAALNLMIPVVLTFGLMPAESIKQSVTFIGVLMTEIGVFSAAMEQMDLSKSAAGLLALAVSMDMLLPVIIAFGVIPFSVIGQGILALGLALTAMLAPMAVAAALSPGIAAAGVAIAALGVAVLAAGVGVAALGVGVLALVTAFTTLITVSTVMGDKFRANVTNMVTGLVGGFADAAPEVINCVLGMLVDLINAIADHMADFIDAGLNLIGSLIKGIITGIPKLLLQIGKGITEAANYIMEHGPEFAEKAKEIILKMIAGILEMNEKVNEAMHKLLDAMIEKIKEFLQPIKDAATGLIDGFLEAIGVKKKEAKDGGAELVEEVADGMVEAKEKATDAAEEVAEETLETMADTLETHSESKRSTQFGEWTGGGLGTGMLNKEDYVGNSAKQISEKAINSMKDKLENANIGDIGGGAIEEFVGGMSDKLPDVTNMAGDIGDTLDKGLDNFIGGTALSTDGQEAVGEFNKGMEDAIPEVENTSKELSDAASSELGSPEAVSKSHSSGTAQSYGFADGLDDGKLMVETASWDMSRKLGDFGFANVDYARTAAYAQRLAVERENAQALENTKQTYTAIRTLSARSDQYYQDSLAAKAKSQASQAQSDRDSEKKAEASAKKQRKLAEETAKELEDIDTKIGSAGGGGGGSGGSGGGGGGSSASKTTQEVKELYDVLKDGAGVITAFDNRFVKLNETLDETADETAENTQSFEVAKGAVSALAEQLFVASDSYDETMAAMDKSSAEYLAGMKEAWDAYKESLESTLVGSVDAFSAFTQASHVSAEDILDNIYSEITGLEMFDETIRGLANSNINPTLLKDLVDGGIQNMDKLMGLLYATDQQRESISKAYETLTNVEANLTDKVMASLALSVDSYDKSIQETLANSEVFQEGMEKLSDNTQFTTSQIVVMFNETQQGLKEVIKSGMSYFDEYEKKQKVSKKELQKNLDDQKKAWEDWGDALNEVIAKGLDKSVVQNLMQMGVESMDKLQGFMDMTEDEIGHYNETVAEYIKIPDKLSAEIAANYTATALDVSNAFKDGIDSTKAEEAIAEMGNNLEQALKDAVGDKGSVQGSALSKSFDDGFKENAIYVYDTIKEFGQNVLDELEIDEGGIADIGENLMKSLAASIKDNSYLVVDALEEVTEEGKDTSEKGFGIGSPSKVFMDIGKFIDQGLAIGIRDNANDVTKQTKNLGNETYKAMDAVVGHILDILEGNEAFSPVITPVLDLDDVTNGMKDIRSMTGNFGVGYSFMQAQNAVNTVPTTQAGAYYNAPITINVYGNDDPDAVANAVQNKINHQIRRLGALG